MNKAYRALEARFAKAYDLNSAIGMLQWDYACFMPNGGAAGMAQRIATLKTLHHQTITAPDMEELLDRATEEELSSWRKANLREIKREYAHAAAIPEALVEALSKASSSCEMAWREAKPKADFALVLPHFREVLKLVKEVAVTKGEKLGLSPYDALIDQYEPGGRADEIRAVFAELEAFLPGFLAKVERSGSGDRGSFPISEQERLGREIMTLMGFDFKHGRLDVSLHPFCGGAPDDVRITTRYEEGNFLKSLMGVIHETGHALYEQGLPKEWLNQPVGAARGMSIHESQSLFWEMQVARSREFAQVLSPLLAKFFNREFASDALYAELSQVKRDFIRVDADEVTYPLHVILRFRLEEALIKGELDPKDLPAAWNQGMEKLLGITPPSDKEGVLQDIHWYDGTLGYFPTYTLGALTAAQLAAACKKAVGDFGAMISKGELGDILSWLRTNIHAKASLLDKNQLLVEASGEALSPSYFILHLKERFGG